MIDFDRNVVTIVRSHQDDPGGLVERRMFACGTCAHSTLDHRWGSPAPCLDPDCQCVDVPTDQTSDQIDARWDKAVQADHDRSVAKSFLVWLKTHTDTFDPVMVRLTLDHGHALMTNDQIDDLVSIWGTDR